MLDSVQIVRDSVVLKRLMVIIIYAVLAKGADLFVDRVLRRLANITSIRHDNDLIDFLHGPVCWTIFLTGIMHSLVLQPLFQDPWLTVLPAAVKTAILLLWLVAVLRGLNQYARGGMENDQSQGKIGGDLFLLLKNLFRVVVIVAGLLWLLAIWQIDMTPLFASAGIAGIAVALAAKDSLANFFGGLSLFMDKTFKMGEYIILDSGERGEVVEIGIRSTRIKTRDDILITIPNSILANSKIINESAPVPRFRIRVPVAVAYGSDLARVEEVLLAVAVAEPTVSETPSPRVRVRSFGDSSVNFELLCWVDDPRLKGRETHKLLVAIYLAFNEHGIVIPFPQRDVHLVSGSNAG